MTRPACGARQQVGVVRVHQRIGPRGANGRRDTVVHGPHGCSATSIDRSSPQYPSTFVTATQRPSRNRGCIGFSAWYRLTIATAAPGSALQPSAVRNSGAVEHGPAAPAPGTCGRAEHGHRGSRPGRRGSGRTSCRTGTCRWRRWPRRTVDRVHAGAGAGRNNVRANVAVSYVASHVRTGTQPSPSGGRGSAVLPSRPRRRSSAIGGLAPERPEPRLQDLVTGPRFERQRPAAVRGGGARSSGRSAPWPCCGRTTPGRDVSRSRRDR